MFFLISALQIGSGNVPVEGKLIKYYEKFSINAESNLIK